ncbi:Ribosome biogenesis protein Alb1 [Cordyceps fumosorosea ARSEF 2679]|uniref:Ribosome biogenesis protein Alb1 n=1 Tax=Cordyceps fumosorosea (strain ARSEF 2679) TaxID=1081104 RepID=A0A167Q178_CORFA|nr:Ribosome biogenesis protein Alb1 [Cordyceps fumosorosea ARSEF 2679]OAA57190.1 Ribosome biogenesis protein Alb1 [Cordyceps fumosorosea ARSEF 2679]
MAKAKAQPSKRSRAARRATSPSIDTDKSLKTAQPPRDAHHKPAERPSVLAVHHSAGVQKKGSQRKARVSAKARRRREKGIEMAEAVVERTSSKVKRSWDRQRAVDGRRQGWDAINKDMNAAAGEDDDDDDDVEMDEKEKKEKKEKESKKGKKGKKGQDDEGWETDENGDSKALDGPVDDGLDEIM